MDCRESLIRWIVQAKGRTLQANIMFEVILHFRVICPPLQGVMLYFFFTEFINVFLTRLIPFKANFYHPLALSFFFYQSSSLLSASLPHSNFLSPVSMHTNTSHFKSYKALRDELANLKRLLTQHKALPITLAIG